jgi:hypothetical protein
MNSQVLLTSLAALGLLAAGCDIFPAQQGGNPAIVRVLAVDQLALTTPPEVDTATGSTYVLGSPGIGGVDASNVNPAGPNGHASRFQIIDVEFNKVMDGATVQKAVDDCTPFAGALAVTVTPAQPTAAALCGDSNQSQISCFTPNWFVCYVPQSSDPTVGSQIMIFQTPGGAAYDPTSTQAGQGAGLLPGYTYAVSGTVKDLGGKSLDYSASVTTQTAAMITRATTTAVDISWNCTSDVASIDIQRAPDSDGTGVAPGTFANLVTTIACTPGTLQTQTDTTGAGNEGKAFWYQLVLHPTTGTAATSGVTNATTLPVADVAPTFTGVAATTVTVNWNPSLAGVDTYEVQRAPDASGVSGTYKTLKSGIAKTTSSYTDTTVVTATKYWYRVVSVAALGVTNNGAEATVTTP